MLRLQRISTADKELYDFMEQLMIASFPPEEYRALDQLRLYTDTQPAFHNNVILDDEAPIGLFTYWDFGAFCYGEHFAIDPARRNGGYGKRALEELCRIVHPRPIVLEVWDNPYRQPPYKPGDGYLPMQIMAYGDIDPEQSFEKVRDCIYRHVYGL